MNLKDLLKKHRNTLFVNATQFDEFVEKNTRTGVRIVGSYHIPRKQVLYVDAEGVLSVHKMEDVGL